MSEMYGAGPSPASSQMSRGGLYFYPFPNYRKESREHMENDKA